MRYRLSSLLVLIAVAAFSSVTWVVTGSALQAIGWACVPVFFGLCYWMLKKRQAETKGSYKYAEGDSSSGAAGGV
jgi:hypothetical protein